MHGILIKLLTLQQRMNIRPLHMNVHELFYLIGVIVFYLKYNVRDTDVDLSAFKHFSGLK